MQSRISHLPAGHAVSLQSCSSCVSLVIASVEVQSKSPSFVSYGGFHTKINILSDAVLDTALFFLFVVLVWFLNLEECFSKNILQKWIFCF